MDNSIPICRSILNHWVYEDSEYLKVWLTMLSQARYKEEPKTVMYEKALCTLNYGEFIFGYKAWSSKTGISYQRLRTLMSRLIEDNMLALQVTTYHYSVYAVVNYSKFNSQETLIPSRLETLTNSQPTDNKQSANNQATTNEEGNKKEKKVKKDYISIPDIDYVHLTQKQYDNIVSKYGKEATDKKIDNLNTWKGSKGGVSKDDNLTLQNWIRRDNDKKQVDKPERKEVAWR